MTRHLTAIALAFALSSAFVSATACASELRVGVPVSAPASAKGAVDMYHLVGESGSRDTYRVTSKGPIEVTLFGPDGSALLTANGSGNVSLEAVLPYTDVFALSIARPPGGTPYTLVRSATTPTLAEAENAWNVGYRSRTNKTTQCWVTLGVKYREVDPAGTAEAILAADRATTSFVMHMQGGTILLTTTWSVVDDKALQRIAYSDGTVDERSSELNFAFDPAATEFDRYMCSPDK